MLSAFNQLGCHYGKVKVYWLTKEELNCACLCVDQLS